MEHTLKPYTQWHPAFFASIQIEFRDECHLLTFENEHQLSTKPLSIDVLIIKKESSLPLKKISEEFSSTIILSNTKVLMII